MSAEAHASRGERATEWIRDPGTPYEVSRVKIVEFAEAIGDPNPAYRDVAAARRAGYPDVIAPPTFAVVVALPASITAAREAFPGTGSPVVVHVEQRFGHSRPILAGDVLHGESEVTGIREMRGTVMVTASTQIRAADGEHICTAAMTLAVLSGNGAATGRRTRKRASPPAPIGLQLTGATFIAAAPMRALRVAMPLQFAARSTR